jgi:hypothetical protein
MEIQDLLGKTVKLETVRSTYRGGSESLCMTMLVEGVGRVRVSLRPERGGDLSTNVRKGKDQSL